MPTMLVLDDTNLAPVGRPIGSTPSTFAQTFSLALGHGTHVTAAGANSQLASLFRADPGDPVLAANQILATLEFIHFENPYKLDARGIVVEPPAFVASLVTRVPDRTARRDGRQPGRCSPVTLNQFFSQVPKGGNDEPASRHLQAGTRAP